MRKAIFVTGTDTGTGKTQVTGLLGQYLASQGERIITQKWIETGSRSFSSDVRKHLKLMGQKPGSVKDHLSFMSTYIFSFPASPHLASRKAKINIDINRIKKSFKNLTSNFDYVIVEGTGGALVPLNNTKLLIDVTKDLFLPVIVVAGNRLGAINHTLMTIEAIKKRKLKLLGIVFNNCYKKGNAAILRDNVDIIKKISKERILGILPYCDSSNKLYKAFLPIGKRIYSEVRRLAIRG